MRHFRMPSYGVNNLETLQKHIGGILNVISRFDRVQKNRALKYVRNSLSTHGKKRHTVGSKCLTNIEDKKRVTRNNSKKSVRKLNTFVCLICNSENKSKRSHLNHLNSHEGSAISCLKCKKTFNGDTSFQWHLSNYCRRRRPLRKPFKCSQCYKVFHLKRNLELHLQGHLRNNCSQCNKFFTKRQQLRKHLFEFHNLKLKQQYFECNNCDKRYVKKRSLYYHLQRSHAKDKIVCLECGHISDNSEESDIHVKTHLKEKKFNCKRCNEKFTRKQQYLLHIKSHNRYTCLTCKESYSSRQKILLHRRQGHLIEGVYPRFICPFCPNSYHQKCRLHLHIKKHSEVLVFCKYCNENFDSHSAYYKHCNKVSHEKFIPDLKKFLCENCGKYFSKEYLLERHNESVHNIIKEPLCCNFCDYKTLKKCNFERHKDLHIKNEETLICEHCAKWFTSKASLKDHVAYKHSEIKSFVCEKCGKAFKRSSELMRHQSSHSSEKPYKCEICGACYKMSAHLRRHEKTAHKIEAKSRKKQKIIVQADGSFVPVAEKPKNLQNEKKLSGKEETNLQNNIYSIQPVLILQNVELVNISDGTTSIIINN